MTRARDLARLGNSNIISADSNFNVGIGSTIPDAKLDVIGIVSATGFYGDGSNLIGVSGGLWEKTDVGINTVSKVGIGTTNPFANLEVKGSTPTKAYFTDEGGTNGTSLYLESDDDAARVGSTYHGGSVFKPLEFLTTGTRRMHISAGGNIGIGTTNPLDLLHVHDSNSGATPASQAQVVLESYGSTNWINFLNRNTQNAGLIWSDTDDTDVAQVYYDHNVNKMYFKSNDTSNALVLHGANLGIGNAIPGSFSGNGCDNLVVGGGSGTEGITVYSATQGALSFADGTSGDEQYRGAIAYNHTGDSLDFRTAGVAERMHITSSGNVGIATDNPTGTNALLNNTAVLAVGVVTANTLYGDGSQLTGISVGINTSASSPTANTIVTLDLTTTQHHELTLNAGITTITTTGGSFGESHSLVLIQPSSGIATVGFSTYFLWPSGSSPSLSQGSSKVDLISFVVKNNNAPLGITTQLLASAGINYQ